MGFPLFPVLPHVPSKVPTSLPTRPPRLCARSGFSPKFYRCRNGKLPHLGIGSQNSNETCNQGKHVESRLGSYVGIDRGGHWDVLVVGSVDLWVPVSSFLPYDRPGSDVTE